MIDIQNILNDYVISQTQYDLEDLLQQLAEQHDDDTYYYDKDEARRFYLFISKLQLDKGKKGQRIKPLKFQFIITSEILCIKDRQTNLRKHREAFLNIARKNGKGSLVSWLATYLYFTDPTYGAEYIIVANDKKQATNLFNTICLMIRNNRTLNKYVTITESQKHMYRKATNSFLRVLSNDGSNLDSYASYVVILDEIHEYKNTDAYTKLRTGMGLWDEPLMFCTTTASSGADPNNLEMELYNYAMNIAQRKFKDDTFYSAIFEAPKDCELMDIHAMIAANPALGTFRKYKDLEDFLTKASRIKSFEAKARRLYLNQHVSLDGENAINMTEWRECLHKVDLNTLRGCKLWAALDMSLVKDITAYVQVFFDENNNKFIVYPHLFTPAETLLERAESDNIRYDMYKDNGDLIALNGKYIDTEELFNYIEHINDKYSFKTQEIAFDRWGSADITTRLEKKYDIFAFGQGYKTMSPAIRDFELMLLDKRLVIHNNELLTLMAQSVVLTSDAAGNVKYDKSKARNKIDGIIAMLMALTRAIYNNDGLQYSSIEELLKEDW